MGVVDGLRNASAATAAEPLVEHAHPGRAWRVAQWTVLAAPVVAFVGAGWAHRWVTDDGFIYLRVVQQLRVGNGPVFNEGQRVEAFTGPLWVAVLTVADLATPIRLEWIAVLLGLIGCAAGLGLAIAGARRFALVEATDAFLLPLGVLVFVAILPSWIFSTSGLETGLAFAWLGLSLWLLAGWARSGRHLPVAHAFLLGLGWLVRPELVVFSAVFLVLVLVTQWHDDRWRDRVRLVGAMIALPLAYQVFRMGFYGSLVANTAIAKEGTSTNWERGWDYFRDFADPYWLWLPGVVLVAGGYFPLALALRRAGERRALCVVAAFLAAGMLDAIYIVAVGGDYIHGRLLLPALFAVCAPVAVVAATRRHLAALLVAPWALVAVLTLRPPEGLLTGGQFVLPRFAGHVTVDDFRETIGDRTMRWYTGPAFYYQPTGFNHNYVRSEAQLSEDVAVPMVALYGIGAPSYGLGANWVVLDALGLADPFGSHLISTPSPTAFPRLAGHEKPMPTVWVAARVTSEGAEFDDDDFPQADRPLIPVTHGAEFQEQVAWARAALRCPDIRELMRAADAPMTAGRFVDNFLDSFDNTRVRIPADPEDAYHRFCDEGTPREVRDVRSAG